MRKFIVTLIRTITTAIAITVIVAVGGCSISRYFFSFLFLVFTCVCTMYRSGFPRHAKY